jgi:DNA ligase-1
MTIGQPFPSWDGRALNLSWAAISKVVDELTAPTEEQREAIWSQAVDGGEAIAMLFDRARKALVTGPPLTLLDVYRTFEAIATIAGRGSRSRKEDLLRGLLVRAQPLEAKYIAKNVMGEMRHGVSTGLMLDAIAVAADVPKELVRRAHMFTGDLGEVAEVALSGGGDALKIVPLRLGRPLEPMLATVARDVAEVFTYHEGHIALEYKLDGARVQIHRDGDRIRIFSRQLTDVTASLPDVAAMVHAGARSEHVILEGEVIAIDERGRPLPFQHLMRRFRRVHEIEAMEQEIPVQLHLFDCLYRDGQALIDRPYSERWQALVDAAGTLPLVRRVLPRTVEEGEAFARQAIDAGHEGVMAKQLSSRYTPGVRGKAWFKIKHALSVDLVVVAADWGYGRRHGWLSNYHLAARDEATGEFMEVGKTFKGLTDEEFRAVTERLLALKQSERQGTVFVIPQIVAEVEFNEIQESPQYPSGLALRFARIKRWRDDKFPEQADTLQMLREIFVRQFEVKGRR